MYRKDDSFLENIFRSQNEKFGRVLHVFVVLPGKKKRVRTMEWEETLKQWEEKNCF